MPGVDIFTEVARDYCPL